MPHLTKWYRSDMAGAPALGTGYANDPTQKGKMNAVIRACLIEGFNPQAILAANMAYSAGTDRVTVEFGVSHGYLEHQIIEISGADQPGYNGQFRVLALTANTIQYKPDTAPSTSPSTGSTIQCKTPPMGGWEKVDEDTALERMALRRTATDASPHTFVFDNSLVDTSTNQYNMGFFATVSICRSDAYTNLDDYESTINATWPASNAQQYASKQTGRKDWTLIGDHKLFYYGSTYAAYARTHFVLLGDIESVRPGDTGHCIVQGLDGSSGYVGAWNQSSSTFKCASAGATLATTFQRWMASSYTLIPGAVAWKMRGIDSYMGETFQYPSLPTNAFFVSTAPIMVEEDGAGMRGWMPGLVQPLQTNEGFAQTIMTNIPGFAGKPVYFAQTPRAYTQNTHTSGDRLIAFKLSDWRGAV